MIHYEQARKNWCFSPPVRRQVMDRGQGESPGYSKQRIAPVPSARYGYVPVPGSALRANQHGPRTNPPSEPQQRVALWA